MNKALIADVGGTNIRFAIAESKKVSLVRKYKCSEFRSMKEAVDTYLTEVCMTESGKRPAYFVAGAAGEINEKGQIELTNSALKLDISSICREFDFQRGLLANDVVFHTIKVLDLPCDAWEELNPNAAESKKNPTACVIVIGTGFGGSYANDGCVEASESGHHEAIPSRRGGKTDENVWSFMREHREGIWEDYVSGPSSLRIYQYLTAIRTDRTQLATTPQEVSALAHKGDKDAIKTYMVMARFLAQFLGQEIPNRHLSDIYLGGLVREFLSIDVVRKEFLETLYDRPGKYAKKHSGKVSVRLIKTSENLAMDGLALVADDLVKTGTTKRILKRDVHVVDREKEMKKKMLEQKRAQSLKQHGSER